MNALRWLTGCAALAVAWVGLGSAGAGAQEYEPYPLEPRIWLDRGEEPVVRRGEQVRVYYRVSESAYVAVFHIDSNGTVRMVFPSSPQENHFARGGRDYRVLFPGSTYWFVDDDPGMGYYFIVASPEPFDFTPFRYSHYNGGWDLSYVGRQVYRDPYLAMDDYVAALIPDWEYVAYALDFSAYHVDGHYDYPRFLCYDCHGFRPYPRWNPYLYSCASYRVVIYDDPYFFPVTRYRGTRVVYVQPRRGLPQFIFKERAVGEVGTPQVVARSTPPVGQPGVEGTEPRRSVARAPAPAPGSAGEVSGGTPPRGSQAVPGVVGTTPRRTGGGVTGVPPTATRPSDALQGGGGSSATRPTVRGVDPGVAQGRGAVRAPDPAPVVTPPRAGTTDRPVLERRPPTGGSAVTPPPSRPTTKVRPRGGGGEAGVTPPSSGGGVVGAPRSGGTTPPGVPSVVRGGGTSPSRSTPAVRPGGSATSRSSSPPSVRGGGISTSRSTPTVRSGGSATSRSSSPPSVRGGAASPSRSAPAVRSGGGAATRSSPPARGGGASSPPARRGGGGLVPSR